MIIFSDANDSKQIIDTYVRRKKRESIHYFIDGLEKDPYALRI